MTVIQEDILYDYLDSVTEIFSIADAAAYIRLTDASFSRRLEEDVRAFIESKRLAFPVEKNSWISRRGFFEPFSFVIKPSRIELQNGILIPGHRCICFANPILFPHELRFLWKGKPVKIGTTEGPPEDFYPFYSLYGEEYAPQYIARDNDQNEAAFNADPYEDPPEVSIHTLDMRAIYRETSFVPGDRFIVHCKDWKGGVYELEKADPSCWTNDACDEWMKACEQGFFHSFEHIGPAASTEEQAAFALFFAAPRIKELPAYALEEFLYEKTGKIELLPYGMETRFWYAGKEIPDAGPWGFSDGPPDKTEIEEILYSYGVPVSEYVVQAYVRDALFLGTQDWSSIVERILPVSLHVDNHDLLHVVQYVLESIEEFTETYNPFSDRLIGPVRHRAAELHTAVVDFIAQLSKGDTSLLPKHTFVILSQIQSHSSRLLEELLIEHGVEEAEIEAMDNSLDGMLETFEDVKIKIDEAQHSFRHSRLSLVRSSSADKDGSGKRVFQAVLGGTKVWRRFVMDEDASLEDLHRVLQILFGWSGGRMHGFVINGEVYGCETAEGDLSDHNTRLSALIADGITEFRYDYDYGAEWELRISILDIFDPGIGGNRYCLAGEGAAPPENIGGALRFRRFVSALSRGSGSEKALAQNELGADFDPDKFDLEACERAMKTLFGKE